MLLEYGHLRATLVASDHFNRRSFFSHITGFENPQNPANSANSAPGFGLDLGLVLGFRTVQKSCLALSVTPEVTETAPWLTEERTLTAADTMFSITEQSPNHSSSVKCPNEQKASTSGPNRPFEPSHLTSVLQALVKPKANEKMAATHSDIYGHRTLPLCQSPKHPHLAPFLQQNFPAVRFKVAARKLAK